MNQLYPSHVVAPNTPHPSVKRFRSSRRHRLNVTAPIVVNTAPDDDNHQLDPLMTPSPPKADTRAPRRRSIRMATVKSYCALYSCEDCDQLWTSDTDSPVFDESQRCHRCLADYRPQCVIDTKGFKPVFNASYYGEYKCSNGQCLWQWSSHQSWLGYQRQCPQCHDWAYPCLLQTHEWVGVNGGGNSLSIASTSGRSSSDGNCRESKAEVMVTTTRSGYFWSLALKAIIFMMAIAVIMISSGVLGNKYDLKPIVAQYVGPVADGLAAKALTLYHSFN